MQGTLVEQGLELMLYGMGTVLLFLTLLVLATATMSRLLARYFPEPVAQAAPVPEGAGATDTRRRVAAIAVAIHRYRGTRQ